jgi:hypothetical protein
LYSVFKHKSWPLYSHHHYLQPGAYEVCVRIVYEGGCEATKCKSVYITIPDECRADFEKLALTPTISPLHVTFKALPWHNNKKNQKRSAGHLAMAAILVLNTVQLIPVLIS